MQIRTNRFKSLYAILGFIQACILIKEWEYSTVSKNGTDRPTFKIIKHSKTSVVNMDCRLQSVYLLFRQNSQESIIWQESEMRCANIPQIRTIKSAPSVISESVTVL